MIVDGSNGYKVFIQENENGIVFPTDDLIEKMDQILSIRSLENYAEYSRMIYLKNYGYDRVCQETNQLYTFCLKDKGVSFSKSQICLEQD